MDKCVLNTSTFNKHESLGNIRKFFFSVSLFSLLVACSLSLSFIFYPFDFHFSTLLLSFFTHKFERKYVFLVFNGILAFLAKKSGIISASSSSTSESKDSASGPSKLEELGVSREVGNAALVEVEDENIGDAHEEETNSEFLHTEEREDGALALGEGENSEDENETDSSVLATAVEEESGKGSVVRTEDVDGSEEVSSTEELNRKIEEFIRKMKEELRVEAQQHLIAAA